MFAFRTVPLYGQMFGETQPHAERLFGSFTSFYECPMCFALVAKSEKHYAWHQQQNPAETKLADAGQSSAGKK